MAGRRSVVDGVVGADRGWVAVYLVVVNQKRWSTDLTMTWDLLRRSVTHGIVPGLAGGPVALGALGAGLAVGHPAAAGDGARLAGTGGGACGFAVPQTAHRAGVADRGRLRGGLPGADISDALVAVHRPRVGSDACAIYRISSWCWRCGRGRVMRAQPSGVQMAGRVGCAYRGDEVWRSRSWRAVVFDGDVSENLAGQPRKALSAERRARIGPRSLDLGCPAAGPGGRPNGAGRVAWPENLASHMFALLRIGPNSPRRQSNCGCWTAQGRLVTRR